MNVSVIVPPSEWPVSQEDVKLHLRFDPLMYFETELFEQYIGASIQYAEAYTRRAVAVQTLELGLDAFPIGSIELPRPPLREVESITYLNTEGDWVVWASEDFEVDDARGIIYPVASFPSTKTAPTAVRIRYVAGYTDEDLPAALRSAILLLVGDLYLNREAQQEVQLYTNRTVNALLFPYRVFD